MTADRGIDVERASAGGFAADPAAVFERWDEFSDWASGLDGTEPDIELHPQRLGAPSCPEPPR